MAAPSRVVWKCRRGMREMDILLGRFLDRGYEALDDADRRAFESLLDRPDQDLLAWLSGSAEPAEPQLSHLIARMRDVVYGP